MADIEKMLDFANSKWHRVTYSMDKRYGPKSYDCSSFVFFALIAGGFLKKNTPIGNTEDLYRLNGKIFKEIFSYEQVKMGDIFIRGYEGNSYGKNGHTGIFRRKGEIIHCNACNNTVSINNESSFINYFLDLKRSSYERYFRPIEKNEEKIIKIKDENWHATCLYDLNVRKSPSTKAEIVAKYKKGELIFYDSVYEADGYRWISYISYSGKRRFVAYRSLDGFYYMSF